MSCFGMGESNVLADPATRALVLAYLLRTGFARGEAEALMEREPSVADLQLMLDAHLETVPFENFSQHEFKACPGFSAVGKNVQSIDLSKILTKIIFERRGGFCFERNFTFLFVLRALGYKSRLANSCVLTPAGPSPGGHQVLFVDGLDEKRGTLMVDPGFGDFVRALVPIDGTEVKDPTLGDTYSIAATSEYGEHMYPCTHVLMRGRDKASNSTMPMMGAPDMEPVPSPPAPVHIFNLSDDLAYDDESFAAGIKTVTEESEQNIFSQKRLCVLGTKRGYKMLGTDYFKVDEDGVEASRVPIKTEEAYRACMKEHFDLSFF